MRLRACFWGFRRRRTLIPEGTRTAFRAEGERLSERSDAGRSIVEQVFGFVKKNLSGDIRSEAEACAPLAEKGVRGKGRSPCPRSAHIDPGERQLDGSAPRLLYVSYGWVPARFFRMESPRISMRCAL